jgi:hypothetical protein
MNHGQSIEIQLVDANGDPIRLSNISIEMHFFTKGNFRYGFKLASTDESGSLRATYDDLEELRSRDAEGNLMDYNTKLDECDPQVKIMIPSEQQLRQQYDNVMRFYQTPPQWAKNWPSNGRIEAPLEVLTELDGQITKVQVPTKLI